MFEALHLHLTTSATSFKPGDTVIALLQASSGASPVELLEVELQFAGVERVDTSWVSPAYRKDVAPINADKRHLQRHVVFSRLQAATQGTLGGSRFRKFVVRFALPTTLPPSFKGTAVRVSYTLTASVHYRQSLGGEVSEPSTPEASTTSFGPSEAAEQQQLEGTVTPDGITTSTVQLPVHIWPLKAESDSWQPTSLAAAPASQEPLPLITSDDMTIKCWEIGPGTGVQEAIAHICRLVAQSSSEATSSGAGSGGEAGTQHGEAREPSDPGDSSASEEGGNDVGRPAASPRQVQRQHSLPLARQSTSQSEGLTTPLTAVQVDPSAVLRSYALRIGEHAIARVSLHPPPEGALYPGATLGGTLELLHPDGPASDSGKEADRQAGAAAAGVPRCMQVLILLETEERLAPQWRPAGKAGNVIRRVYEEQLDLTADIASTHFVFTVPPGSQANFSTPLLQLQWVLRFQFTASTARQGGSPNPLQGKIDQLTWALPLHVGAPQ
ncbi:hypothetical protein N2152v2_007728 [Parachlorella kessleri]